MQCALCSSKKTSLCLFVFFALIFHLNCRFDSNFHFIHQLNSPFTWKKVGQPRKKTDRNLQRNYILENSNLYFSNEEKKAATQQRSHLQLITVCAFNFKFSLKNVEFCNFHVCLRKFSYI